MQALRWKPEERPLVSIIIVLFNSTEHIPSCVKSLAELKYGPFEVIMVDNGSEDESARTARDSARAAGLKCVISELSRNRGFAAAGNHGFSLSHGEIILMLAPDTELYSDTVGELVDALRDIEVGVAGCRVYYPDRSTIQHAGGYVRDNGLTAHNGAGQKDVGQFDEVKDVAFVTGTALAVSREVFVRAGRLDAGYHPSYFEEADFCLRVRRLGYRVIYVPSARAVHYGSTDAAKFTERHYFLYHKNRVRFLLKNFSWRFMMERSLPMEEEWLRIIAPWEQAVPLNMGYLVNIASLPRTLLARRRMERTLGVPRLEDTVSTLQAESA